jgi:hypothetical protein
MERRKVLVIVISIVLMISAAAAIYLDINKKSKVLTQTEAENNEIDDNSPSTSSPSKAVSSQPIATINNNEPSVPNKWGNTQSNIFNGGAFAQNGNDIFFSYHDNKTLKGFNLTTSRLDGTTALREIYNQQVSYINIVGEWIYFINPQGYICKIKQNGESFTIVKTGRFYNLIVYDNNLYYMEMSYINISPLQFPNEVIQIASDAINFTLSDDGKSLFYIKQSLDLVTREIYQITLRDLSAKLFYKSPDNGTIIGMHNYKNHLYVQTLNFELSNNTPNQGIVIIKIDIATSKIINDKYISIDLADNNLCNISGDNMYAVAHLDKQLFIYIKNLENGSLEQIKFETNDLEITNFYVLEDTIFLCLQDYAKSEIWIYNHTNKTFKKSTFDGYYFLIKS